MQDTAQRLTKLVATLASYVQSTTNTALSKRPQPNKWSKKEIVGHLIDSGLNNLQRFTEIQSATKPYTIRPYPQDALVLANGYQQADPLELLGLLQALNARIGKVMQQQTGESLAYAITLPDGQARDLRFLMEDYVDHFAHHLQQITA